VIIAVFSDLHANLPALERFVEETAAVAERYICLGDVVNYGPWNDECLEKVTALPGLVYIQGNHERLFLGEEDVTREIPLVQDFFTASKRSFTRRDLVRDLPRSFELGGRTFTHTIGEHNQRIYPDTTIEPDRDYVIGHSHHQFIVERGGKTIVNPGSLGQNRKRVDRMSYALLDTAGMRFELRESPYDFDRLAAEMRARDYPPACVDYYLRKVPR
jgi:predicted phosphodiesterase